MKRKRNRQYNFSLLMRVRLRDIATFFCPDSAIYNYVGLDLMKFSVKDELELKKRNDII